MKAKRPNFIIFMTDQQRADHLGCYGNSTVKTPNVDRLANGGIRFEEFYVANPLCQPNRACIATGQMGSVNGCRQNGIPISVHSLTYADILRANGYNTAAIGKTHFQNVSPIPPRPRETMGNGDELSDAQRLARQDQRIGEDYQWEYKHLWAQNPNRKLPLPYYGFDHVKMCIGHGDLIDGHYTSWLLEQLDGATDPRGPKASLNVSEGSKAYPQIWDTAVPEELYPTTYIKNEAISFIENQDDDAPFCMLVSFPDPHHPFTPPGKYRTRYDPNDMELPESFNHPVYARNDLPQFIIDAYEMGKKDPNAYWPFHLSEEHLRKIIALNYGSISFIDDVIGEIMNALVGKGFAENTVTCFMSDHGDYMGDHGTVLKSGAHYQSIIRVPFVWNDPQSEQKGKSTKLQGSAIDFAPTILQRAGIKIPIGMQGRDLFSNDAENLPILIEDAGIGVFKHGDARTAIYSLVHEGWRMSIFEGETLGELFNLNQDPDEMTNLWADKNAQQKKSEMLELLVQRQIALRDLSLSASAQA